MRLVVKKYNAAGQSETIAVDSTTIDGDEPGANLDGSYYSLNKGEVRFAKVETNEGYAFVPGEYYKI
jgi:hypothetical protein